MGNHIGRTSFFSQRRWQILSETGPTKVVVQIHEWPRDWALAFIGIRGAEGRAPNLGRGFSGGSEFAWGELTFPEAMHAFDAVDRNRRAPCCSRTS